MAERFGLTVHAEGDIGSGPPVLHDIAAVIAGHGGEVYSVDVTREAPRAAPPDRTFRLSFELELLEPVQPLVEEVRALPAVREAALVKSLQRIYGKRIIIMGGGAQVGQVAIGAISEADRHNIRGERISVDTIPLVGEQPLADAVRAVARLPRACALVLAGSLMGGDIERAVREVRAQGLLVVSLNMAGSVPDAADFVVTDPVQAGVMTVMAVAETARFSVARLKRRVF
jgi:energy-converting hydrogenase B subunit Q